MEEQVVQDVVKSSSKLQKAKQKILVFLNKPIVQRIFDNSSSTAWKGALVGSLATCLLLWYPLGFMAALIDEMVSSISFDLYFDKIHNPLFYDDMGGGWLAPKNGKFFNGDNAIIVFSLMMGFLELLHILIIFLFMFLFRKKLKKHVEATINFFPKHIQNYSAPLIATAVFTLGWSAARVSFPFIFGIVWNIAFPCLVGLFTWITIHKKDSLIKIGQPLFKIRNKIPKKFRVVSLLAFTALISFIVMSIKPNTATQFKEQIIVLLSILLGFIISTEIQEEKATSIEKGVATSFAFAFLFFVLLAILPSVSANPIESMHPHSTLDADRFYPGPEYPGMQSSILGGLGCAGGSMLHVFTPKNKPDDEQGNIQTDSVEQVKNDQDLADQPTTTVNEVPVEESTKVQESEASTDKTASNEDVVGEKTDIPSEQSTENKAPEPKSTDSIEPETNVKKSDEIILDDGNYIEDLKNAFINDFINTGRDLSEIRDQLSILGDPKFWNDFGGGTIEDVKNTVRYVIDEMTIEDVKEKITQIKNGVGTVVKNMIDNPIETLMNLTPIGDLKDSMDPDKNIIQRIGHMGIALADIYSTIGTGGTAKVAKTGGGALIDAGKAIDAKGISKVSDGTPRLPNKDEVVIGRPVHSTDGKTFETEIPTFKKRPPLTDEVIEQRKADWQDTLKRSEDRVNEYKNAIESEDVNRIDKAMIELKRDKVGMQILNKETNDAQKTIFIKRTDKLHDSVDSDLKDFAQDRFNLGKMDGPVRTAEGKVWTNPDTGEQFIAVETSNPTGVIKVGSDRDITYRVVKRDKDGGLVKSDIDHREVKEIYDKSYHEHSRAKELGYDESPKKFTELQDQSATDARAAEAYGSSQREGKSIIDGDGSFGGIQGSETLGKTVEYKSNIWYGKGGEGDIFEGIRNSAKQQDTQFKNLETQLRELNPDHHLLKERVVDPSLVDKMGTRNVDKILQEMDKMKVDPRTSKSPVEIEKMIQDEGFGSLEEFNNHVSTRTATFEMAVKHLKEAKK
ncbi:MAG: hypothetical protein VW230_03945 [Candidatus Poseidoniales archaeon]